MQIAPRGRLRVRVELHLDAAVLAVADSDRQLRGQDQVAEVVPERVALAGAWPRGARAGQDCELGPAEVRFLLECFARNAADLFARLRLVPDHLRVGLFDRVLGCGQVFERDAVERLREVCGLLPLAEEVGVARQRDQQRRPHVDREERARLLGRALRFLQAGLFWFESREEQSQAELYVFGPGVFFLDRALDLVREEGCFSLRDVDVN